MKKVLILVCILCMVSLTPAAFQISVEGNVNPVDSEIISYPSDTLILDIHTSEALPAFYSGYLLMAVDSAMGTLSGGIPTQWEPPIIIYYDPYYFLLAAGLPADWSAVAFAVAHPDLQVITAGVIFDLINFHCEAPGDAVVQLWASPDGAYWDQVDQVTIHQIPEPVTMVLLGFGGQLMRKRK